MIPLLFTFLEWTSSSTDQMLGYAGGLFSDLSPLIVIILGISILGLVFQIFLKR